MFSVYKKDDLATFFITSKCKTNVMVFKTSRWDKKGKRLFFVQRLQGRCVLFGKIMLRTLATSLFQLVSYNVNYLDKYASTPISFKRFGCDIQKKINFCGAENLSDYNYMQSNILASTICSSLDSSDGH